MKTKSQMQTCLLSRISEILLNLSGFKDNVLLTSSLVKYHRTKAVEPEHIPPYFGGTHRSVEGGEDYLLLLPSFAGSVTQR